MRVIRLCLCEDDVQYRTKVKDIIVEKYPEVKVFECDDRTFSFEEDYDAYIFDIELHERSGISIAEEIRRKDKTVSIMFLTSYDEHAREGYRIHAEGYVSKQHFDEEFYPVLDRMMKTCKKKNTIIEINSDGRCAYIDLNDVYYFGSQQHYVFFKCKKQLYRTRISINQFIEDYPMDNFVQCVKGQYVNMKYIAYVEKNKVVLENGDWISLSKQNKKVLGTEYRNFMFNKMMEH